ncbi:MAG: hypothetical protein GC179_16615 [Anaerolineaceae bacterium]|nr:hypothetical protein [Anaerolineaceae bacterium]
MVKSAFTFAHSADHSLIPATANAQTAQRWLPASHPLQMRHFSGISRTTLRHKMSIQRPAPVFPPDISAEVLQNLHKLRILRIKNIALSNDVF